MSKGPGLFSEFAKKSRDLLTKDYLCDQKISIFSTTESGLALSSNIVKKGSLSSGYLAAQYKYKKAHVDVKIETETNQVLASVIINDVLPSTKTIASINFPDFKSGKLALQYLHQQASFSAASGLSETPALDFSATVGTSSVAFGAEATYATSTGNFDKYNAGVSFTNPDYNISAILADKGDSIRVSCMRYLPHLNGGALVGEISRKFSTNENTVTVGCSYIVDPQTLVKAKLNNHGNLATLVQHELKPKSFLTVSGAFDTKALNDTPKIGMGLSFCA